MDIKWIFLVLTIINSGHGAKILGVFLFHGKSHYVMYEALMKGLADRGHEVDVVNHWPQKKTIPRFKDISIRGIAEIMVNNLPIDQALSMDMMGTIDFASTIGGLDLCKSFFDLPIATELFEKTKNGHYDLIIMEIFGTECPIVLSHGGKVPVVAMTSSYQLPWGADRFGLVDNPSYVQSYFYPLNDPTSLYQRILNTAALLVSKFSFHRSSTIPTDAYLQQKFGRDIPSIETLVQNMSLLLTNSHFSTHRARPIPPNVKEVAGLHIRKLGKLPEDIEKVINNSKKGVIYFSLGSMVRTESFPVEKQRALLDAFAEFPDYTVFWKAEGDKFPEPIPKNIHFATWLPQFEMLCHPKVKVFITHGGLMGTQEALQCGIPLVGLPFFGDQSMNVDTYVYQKLAVKLDYYTYTKEHVVTALKAVLENPSYRERAKHFSDLFLDRPFTAMEEAIYWVEYVIRHKGAPHLKPANTTLSWYQIYLIDVAFVFISALSLIISLIYFIILFLYRKFFKSNKKLKKTYLNDMNNLENILTDGAFANKIKLIPTLIKLFNLLSR